MILLLNSLPIVGILWVKNFLLPLNISFIQKSFIDVQIHSYNSHSKEQKGYHFFYYWLISLCNTFYKVIDKLLANILKKALVFIIHKAQLAFIKGRDIANNITLAQKICGEINSSIHGKAFCAKIDFKKAFDSISRNFILLRLKHMVFPTNFIEWIKACILEVLFPSLSMDQF